MFIEHLNNRNTALDVAAYLQAVESFASCGAGNTELAFDV